MIRIFKRRSTVSINQTDDMKNSGNLAILILVFVTIGCVCPRSDLFNRQQTNQANVAATREVDRSDDSTTRTTASGPKLSMKQYSDIKIGMTKKDVNEVVGFEGNEMSSSSGGGQTFSVYQWKGEGYSSIIITFRNDKVFSKSQVGLD